MVEVVVPLPEGDESSDDVVAGRVAVVEGLVTEPVSQRVDAEGGLLDKEDLLRLVSLFLPTGREIRNGKHASRYKGGQTRENYLLGEYQRTRSHQRSR